MLSKGSMVRVSVRFKGREVTHPELGMNQLKGLFELIGDAGTLTVNPTHKGNELFMVLRPNAK